MVAEAHQVEVEEEAQELVEVLLKIATQVEVLEDMDFNLGDK